MPEVSALAGKVPAIAFLLSFAFGALTMGDCRRLRQWWLERA